MMNFAGKFYLSEVEIPSLPLSTDAPLCFRWRLPGEDANSPRDQELIDSIRKFGFIHPPLLAEHRYGEMPNPLIIQGYRRLAAARALGRENAGVMMMDASRISAIELIRLWMEDIPGGAPPSGLEKIIITRRAARFLGDEWHNILEDLSAVLGRKLSPEFAEELWELLKLDRQILEHLHRGKLTTGDLLQLSGHPSPRVPEAARYLATAGLSRKRQREAVKLILRLGDQMTGDYPWKEIPGWAAEGTDLLMEKLREACYPRYSEDLKKIDQARSEMHLPSYVSVNPPPRLEGGNYRIDISVRNVEALRTALDKLQAALRKGLFDKLFDILRGK